MAYICIRDTLYGQGFMPPKVGHTSTQPVHNRPSLGKALKALKSARHAHRKVMIQQNPKKFMPTSWGKVQNLVTLKKFASITALPPSDVKHKLAAPVNKQPVDPLPSGLKDLRAENDREESRILKELEDLPAPPTTKPKIRKSQATEAPPRIYLPLEKSEIEESLKEVKSVRDLVDLWNHINTGSGKKFLSLGDRLELKQKFPGRLNMVSRQPGQAKLISPKIIETMIPQKKLQGEIARQILDQKTAQANEERRNQQ